MDILISATVIGTALLVIPLAVVVRGIRQERAGLDSRDAGLCAALTRKLLGLSGSGQPAISRATVCERQSSPDSVRRVSARRTVLVTGARS
jgi:hypothetical protein